MIRGGKPLFGEVTVSGAKNAVVAIIPAAILVDGVCRIENVPMVRDVPLARTLHAACEVGQEMPPDLYNAVARLLAFVMALRAKGSAAGTHRLAA